MDATSVNFRPISTLVGEVQHEYVTGGLSQHEARKRALAEVGATLEPPMVGAELEYWLGAQYQKLYSGQTAPKKTKRSYAKNVLKRYQQWVDEHDTTTNDIEIAHWAGCSPSGLSFARKVLTASGYKFEKVGRKGWKVVARPTTGKTYTEAEVKVMLETLMNKFGKDK